VRLRHNSTRASANSWGRSGVPTSSPLTRMPSEVWRIESFDRARSSLGSKPANGRGRGGGVRIR
jgi:hypothetical protein